MKNALVVLVAHLAAIICYAEANIKRTGDATWYDLSVGLTACGTQDHNGKMVAATAFHFWTNPNPNADPMCHRSARVSNPANGRSVTVRIHDKCRACKPDDIDLSPAAFKGLGVDQGVGRFKVNWNFL